MIPKVIHYCWFGRNPLPPLAIKCIESWKKFLPEYEIIEWNEDNFDLNAWLYTKQAYDMKKYAFVSDVCRLYAIKEYGGIYMDTDVEVLKPLDDFLHHQAFSGFENTTTIPTGLMASEKNGQWVTDLLEYYMNRPFVIDKNLIDTTPNTIIITDMMIKKGIVINNKFQEIKNYVAFYPNDYFCPKSYFTNTIELTDNSYCIHHFASSWLPKKTKNLKKIKFMLMRIFGSKTIQYCIDFCKKN
jgi:mannosyltransferase OCH1-like enzyme